MKVVKVYGALRKRLGQCRFELDVTSPGQAIKALCVNYPNLEKWLIDSEKDGVAYRVMVGKQRATEQDVSPLLLPFGEREVFSITPVIAGAGRGIGTALLGVALIGTAIVTGGTSLTFGIGGFSQVAGASIGLSVAAGNIGLALLFGGLAQMISPTPKPRSIEEAQQLESFTFSGIVNTAKQGVPVPVVLGRAFAGSIVISSGLDVA